MEDFYSKHIGEVYGRLTITGVVRNPKPKFVCSCSCGNDTTTDVHSVLSGKTQSCRCIQKELIRERGKDNLRPAVKIGEVFKNKKGLDFEVVEYVKSHKVKIKFLGSGFEVWSAVKEIKKGSIRDWIATPLLPAAKYVRTGIKRKPAVEVGEIVENFYGCKFEVIELLDDAKCRVKFLDSFGYEKVVLRNDAKRGIRNPFRRSVAGIGYIGDGWYSPANSRQVFTIWSNMIVRCYDEESLKKNITYVGCSVDGRWHCFQDFASWCEAQPEFVNNKDWCLDKDIIERGNKIYSPDKCSFVPRDINNLFTLRGNERGEYPLGVHKERKYGRFIAQVNKGGKRVCLGRFDTPEEAFVVYKAAKEEVIKNLAVTYKDSINKAVYESLINWNIEVTD
jgi:hypothetical protein